MDIPIMWTAPRQWSGDAYIIGGGPSLDSFDFSLLADKQTIGCNEAFQLGNDIVDVCCFGDASWFYRKTEEGPELEDFANSGGLVVTNAPALFNVRVEWLKQMHRVKDGLGDGDIMGWNYSTGALGVNLAISLGATRIFCLGFDCSFSAERKTHWHEHYINAKKPTNEGSFRRFLRGFVTLETAIQERGGIEVYNVTDGSSQLPSFPRKRFDEVFSYEHHLSYA